MIYLPEVNNLADIGNYYYGQDHVMKPQRIRMTHQLIMGYGLYQHLQVFVSYNLAQIKNKKNFSHNAFIWHFILVY